jgi:hypothetical protein
MKSQQGENPPAVDQGLLDSVIFQQLREKPVFGGYESKSRSQAISMLYKLLISMCIYSTKLYNSNPIYNNAIHLLITATNSRLPGATTFATAWTSWWRCCTCSRRRRSGSTS